MVDTGTKLQEVYNSPAKPPSRDILCHLAAKNTINNNESDSSRNPSSLKLIPLQNIGSGQRNHV